MDITLKARKFTEHVARNIELLTSGQFSDFVLRCNDHQFQVHRVILLGHSKFFDALIKNPFKESAEGCVDLSEDDVETLAIVVWFLYTAQYPRKTESVNRSSDRLLKWAPYTEALISAKYSGPVRIALAADRFDLPELEFFALNALDKALDETKLKELEKVNDFEQAVQTAFDEASIISRPALLIAWNIVSKIVHGHEDIQLLGSFGETIPRFSWSILSELARCNNPSGKTCTGCSMHVPHFDNRYALAQIRDIDSGSASIVWLGCLCLFRGFCSRRCRVWGIDTCSKFSYCSRCRLAEGQETRWCHLIEDSPGGLRVIEEGVECKASLENDEEYIFRV